MSCKKPTNATNIIRKNDVITITPVFISKIFNLELLQFYLYQSADQSFVANDNHMEEVEFQVEVVRK